MDGPETRFRREHNGSDFRPDGLNALGPLCLVRGQLASALTLVVAQGRWGRRVHPAGLFIRAMRARPELARPASSRGRLGASRASE
jgi:hypothetical protein